MIGRYTRTMTAAALIATLGMMTSAKAEEGAEATDFNTGAISVEAGVDVVSQYWFRGIAQENQGVIVQPWATIGFNLYSADDGVLSSVDIFTGVWGSLHSGPSGSGGAGNIWYETDFYAGISATVSDFTFTVTYTAYTSPNGLFATTQEIAVGVGYDDKAIWAGMGLDSVGFTGFQPSILIAFEFQGGADGVSGEGVYLELGIAPGFELGFVEKYPITITFPVKIGLSLDDYYEFGGTDDTFGYVTFGVEGSVPLSFIPAKFGEWTFTAGLYVIVFGDNTQLIAGAVTGGDDAEVFAKFGFSFSY